MPCAIHSPFTCPAMPVRGPGGFEPEIAPKRPGRHELCCLHALFTTNRR